MSAAQTQEGRVRQCLCRPQAGQQCYHGIIARTPLVAVRVGHSSASNLGRQISGGSISSGGSVRTGKAGSDDSAARQELAETVWNMFAFDSDQAAPDCDPPRPSSDLSNAMDGSSDSGDGGNRAS